MNKVIIISLLMLFGLQVFAQKQTIVKGSMKAYSYDFVLKSETAIEKLSGNKQVVERDGDGNFEIAITLTQPGIFNLGYTSFYMTPGDEIIIVEEFKNERPQYSFEGDNSIINNFIKKHFLHTKSGSWCQAGMNVMKYKEVQDFIAFCNQEKEKYFENLKLLKASRNFKNEYAKSIRFHYYNSLISYPQYLSIYNKGIDTEPIYDVIKKSLPRKIKIEGVDSEIERTILSSNIINHLGIELETNQKVDDYKKVSKLLSALESDGISSELIQSKNDLTKQFDGTNYMGIINSAFEKYNKVLPGAIVDDLSFINTMGENVKLSEYRGKVIVIDVWATWCGPCMKEKPHFAELAKEYIDNKNVVFLAVSVDDSKAWEKYCSKHHEIENVEFVNIERAKMDVAFLTKFIPRFIVIGKNRKIIDAFAPKPSSGKLDESIQKAL